MGTPERTILLIGGGVLALVVVAVVAVLTLGSAEADDFPPDSPPGVIQRYLDAAYDGDRELAFSFLSERARTEMERNPDFRCFEYDDEQRVRVEDVHEEGDRATVFLEIETSSGSIFDFDEYDYERQVFLLREDGGWKIDETYFCV